MAVAPRTGFGSFDHIHEIYYTTDDGFAELRPREEPRHDARHVAGLYEVFARYEDFHRNVARGRRNRIHLVSVVGGLYGLNLIPIFQPREITFFDVNPHAIAYFNLIRRVWIDSRTMEAFLGRLTNADYEVGTPQEEVIRRCIAAKQNGTLAEEEGRSARSFLSSWRYALDHFDLTRGLLADAPVHARVEAMDSQDFSDFVADQEDLWIYCSNIFLFVFFDLTFRFPQNAALFASYYDETEMLDLGTAASAPVTVHCRIPMAIER
ncbi:MAG TPA: hypothetical protein VNN08_26090 [Thermoanaerobaculia bacterium]|nr:hypothetical protein [Thermoanaerobaculia bacterium]